MARAWGDKAAAYLTVTWPQAAEWILPADPTATTFNPMACFIATLCVGLLLCGVKESKRVTNFFTTLKVALVALMVVAALTYTRPSNWIPWAPYGLTGVARGATSTFFGYLGYDQVCCLAGEVKDAKRDLPRAVLGVLMGCAALYVVAALALTGMIPFEQISVVAGFPDGFAHVGNTVVAQITALGEIATMPIVILVTVMVQPRLQYAMAVDGLLPSIFHNVDNKGNLFVGTAIAGSLFIVISTLVPFENLNDAISAAVLSALSLTDTSVIMLWHEPAHDPESPLTCHLMMLFHAAALVGGMCLTHGGDGRTNVMLTSACGVVMVASCWCVYQYCPRVPCFGGRRHHYHENDLLREEGYFQTPWVPFLPCLAIAINWWLMAQLGVTGIALLLGFLSCAVLYYLMYAQYHSVGYLQDNTHHSDTLELSSDSKEADETTKLVA